MGTAEKIDGMLAKLRDLVGIQEGDEDDAGGVGMDDDDERKVMQEKEAGDAAEIPFKPFTLSIDDPSGNSFCQFVGSHSDPQWNMRAYNRTFDQNVTLGLVARPDDMPEQQVAGGPMIADDHRMQGAEDFEARRSRTALPEPGDGSVIPEEIFSFPSTCSSCGHELETMMQQVNIPYFQVSVADLPVPRLMRPRTSSSWPRIATLVGTEITRSSLAGRYRTRVRRSHSRWRTRRI